MELRILGAFEVFHEGSPLPVAGAKPKAVLAILALRANEIVSSDRLAEELWSSPPETARATLQVYVAQLRKLFDPERTRGAQGSVLLTRSPGYLLQIRPDQLDSQRFERLLRDGTAARAAGDAASAALQLREALSLWRGPALADFAYEPFAQAEIARLEDLRFTTLEERIDADLALGRHGELTGELESLTSAYPLRERLCAQFMLALYRAGRQADALEAYMAAHRTLDEQVGIAPGPALNRLQEQILRQDPALSAGYEPAAAVPVGQAVRREVRKTVTVLLAGRTAHAGLDPEALAHVYARHRDAASRAIERHGGAVQGVLADRVMGVFGIPRVHEDDPVRAARAAVELLDDAAQIGIATGEVVTSKAEGIDPSLAGEPVRVAAELEDAASAGQVLLADETRRLLGDRVRAEPVSPTEAAWRLLELVPAAAPFSGSPHAPIVGRDAELAELHSALERAAVEQDVRLLMLIGSAGIGKTRLAEEFVQGLDGEATVVAGRCVAYGRGITFWPLREMVARLTAKTPLSRLLGAEPDGAQVARLVTEAVGSTGSSSSLEEIFWAFRRLLESTVRERPLVVLIEDVHWAEAALLDFVDYVADRGRGPMLLLCLARPELLEARPGWGEEKRNVSPLVLAPLSLDESARLVDNIVGAIPETTRARVLETAEGNPLFLEQMLAMLAEGAGGEGEVRIPPTIQAVLAARLDRLGPGERAVIDTAAVVGKEFPERALAELLPHEARPFAGRHIEALVHKDLLEPARSALGDGPTFRFRHVLIQQAAYRMIPKAQRATLHERMAAWLERSIGRGTAEHAEQGGHHLEEAYRYRAELGPLADSDRELARRAAALLAIAGKRAFGRGDMPAAANLLGRSVSLVREPNSTAVELLPDLGYALFEVGELDEANRVLSAAVEQGRLRGDRGLEWSAGVKLAHVRMYTNPEDIDGRALVGHANEAIGVLTEAGDKLGLARACTLLTEGLWIQGKMTAAAQASARAAEHAHRADSARDESWAVGASAMALLHGPMPAAQATSRTERLLQDAGGSLVREVNLSGFLACHEAMTGRLEQARARIADSSERVRDLGLTWQLGVQQLMRGHIELFAGDPVASEYHMHSAKESFTAIGDRLFLSTALVDLPRPVYAQGRYEEAWKLVASIDEVPAPADAEWRIKRPGVHSCLLARAGRYEEAEARAREGVAVAAQTDMLWFHADALMDLAEVLRLAGRATAAAEAAGEALALYKRKGIAPYESRARAVLEGLRTEAAL
jgi:DNA-binding SARP family transcriptional activator